MKKKHTLLPTLETRYANPSLWEKIQQLDLQGIFDRMIVKYKWSKRRTEKAVREYREFLYISQVLETSLSPTTEADEIWHQHILHTKKYADDCQILFGEFLHHYPFPVALKRICGVCEVDEEKVDCKSDTQRIKAAFCGVDGDGDKEEENPQPKPKKRILQNSVCDGGGKTCMSNCKSDEQEKPKSKNAPCTLDCGTDFPEEENPKPKKQFVNLADVRAQFFVLN